MRARRWHQAVKARIEATRLASVARDRPVALCSASQARSVARVRSPGDASPEAAALSISEETSPA